MEKSNEYLGSAPIGKLLAKLAIPAIAAQLINMLYNLVDRVYIGHIPENGSLALTGLGVCAPIIMVVSAFAALVSMGGAPRASMSMGKGEPREAERILGSCVSLQTLLSIVLTAVLLLFNRPLLMAFGASENTIGYATDYMRIYALGTIFVQLTLGLNAFITAQGFAKTGMLTVLIGALCNIVLDPIFIFGFGMGVRGAALATVLSQGVSTIWVVLFLSSSKSILRIRKKFLKPNLKLLMPVMALGLAPFIMQASESVLNVCFNSSLQRYGGDIAVGAMTILASVMQFTMLPLQGLSQGAIPIGSFNYGAKNPERVRATFRLLAKLSVLYSTMLWAFIMLFPALFARIFTPDAALIAFTGRALRVYAAAMFIMGIQIACQMTLISVGDSKASVTIAVVRKFVLLIPLIYILPAFLPDRTMAVYLAEPVADFIAVTFTMILFAKRFRRALRELEA